MIPAWPYRTKSAGSRGDVTPFLALFKSQQKVIFDLAQLSTFTSTAQVLLVQDLANNPRRIVLFGRP